MNGNDEVRPALAASGRLAEALGEGNYLWAGTSRSGGNVKVIFTPEQADVIARIVEAVQALSRRYFEHEQGNGQPEDET